MKHTGKNLTHFLFLVVRNREVLYSHYFSTCLINATLEGPKNPREVEMQWDIPASSLC
jgi:hypothetical protein